MQKIVKKTLRCGTTGEWYTVNTLVTVVDQQQQAIEAKRRAAEERACREAEAEALATRRHRQLRLDVQKVGWRPAGV